MRPILISLALVLVAVSTMTCVLAEDEPAPATGIETLGWLAGKWRGPATGGNTWETVYTTPEAGMILSASKEMKAGKIAMFEYERFNDVDGTVVMHPHPFGKPSKATFPMTGNDVAKKRAVFENPEHDFPRKIVYHRTADDKLAIEIVGDMGGGEMTIKLDLTRVE